MEEVGVEMRHVQSRMHSDYDSAESIADSHLEDGELPRARRKIRFFSQTHSFRKPEAKIIQKRGACANRTQADHSRRESLKSNSFQETRASGKPDAVFSSRSDEPGNQFESSFFKYADPSELERSLLDSNKRSFVKQEHQIGSINNCIGELQQQAYAQGLELQDAHHGYVESRREQVRLQEELSMKEKLLRDTQIRSMPEMGEMKRGQERRIDEVSVQKLRENHETTQKLTSQLQEMQDQMNSVCDSGEFLEVESNHSGRLSHVPSQPEVIPSSSSMLSRVKRLPFDTWNTCGLQENVFGQQFSTFDNAPGWPG